MKTTEIESLIDSVKKLTEEVSELRQSKKESSTEELLTRQEVARFLKIDLTTLHHWTKSGILKKYGIGKRVYYKKSEIYEAIVELETLKS
ncbi:MAG: helix-turn-helix domain-containing protein [Christiangramia sp.]